MNRFKFEFQKDEWKKLCRSYPVILRLLVPFQCLL